MAYRARHRAAADAVAQLVGVDEVRAADAVEVAGLRRVSNVLGRLGLAYAPDARAWLPMAAAG